MSGLVDKMIQSWDVEIGVVPIGPLTRHDHWISSVVFLQYGKYVVSGSDDGEIRVWDVEQGGMTHNSCTRKA